MARPTPDIPNASMADIAFLLLVFFLVTTTVANIKGLYVTLPPPPDAADEKIVDIPDRNIFKIQVNSADALLVEGEIWEGSNNDLTRDIKEFIMNPDRKPELSDSPKDAIVSYKTDRGTSHGKFIEILDVIQRAYHDIYAQRAGVTNARWREIAANPEDPKNRELWNRGKDIDADGKSGIPMALSIAEPTKVGGN